MHKFGILSDTHGLIRDEVTASLKNCEAIIHAGDIDKPSVLDRLEEIAPVYAVRGNADNGEWADRLPITLPVSLFGVDFLVIHNKKQLKEDLSDKKVIIYGHTHKYHEEYKNGRLWLNPGSCGHRKPSQPITLTILEVNENGDITPLRIDISPTPGNLTEQTDKSALPEHIDIIIKKAIKLIKSGYSVEETAKGCHISNELSSGLIINVPIPSTGDLTPFDNVT